MKEMEKSQENEGEKAVGMNLRRLLVLVVRMIEAEKILLALRKLEVVVGKMGRGKGSSGSGKKKRKCGQGEVPAKGEKTTSAENEGNSFLRRQKQHQRRWGGIPFPSPVQETRPQWWESTLLEESSFYWVQCFAVLLLLPLAGRSGLWCQRAGTMPMRKLDERRSQKKKRERVKNRLHLLPRLQLLGVVMGIGMEVEGETERRTRMRW